MPDSVPVPTPDTAATVCEAPLYPNGPECVEQAGHDGPHHGIGNIVQWSGPLCWHQSFIDGQEYRCILDAGHEGGHGSG